MYHETDAGFILLAFWIAVGFVALYFLPAFVAFNRDHKAKMAILAVNFLFGWSVVGWIVALVWALARHRKNDRQR